ncbi:MAG: restriction endonuclease subunit S [bacterium]
MSELPNNWIKLDLSEIANIVYGKGLPTNKLIDTGYPVFGANGVIGYTNKYIYENEEVLISCRGAYSGKINISPAKCHVTNNSLILEFNKVLYKYRKYFYYILQAVDKTKIVTGSAQPQVTINNVKDLSIPLPPLPEQHRIVAKIEELFTRLDAGVKSLRKAKALLKQYRQSVLKAAVEGRLTEEWRTENAGRIEPASVLLERIQAERKQRLGKKYKPPNPIDTSNLPDLPEGWVWANIQSIGEVVTGTTPSKSKLEYYGNDYPFYKPTDLNSGYFVNNSTDALSYIGIEKARLLPENTVLVTCIGATIGKTGLIRKEGASNQQINAILTEQCINSEYLYFTAISPFFQNQIISKASSTTLPILNKSKFEELPIMITSIEEQVVIVKEIERLFSIIDDSERIFDSEFKRSQSLRQSILKRAFEGKLVPQDPNDEPASMLLERIKIKQNKSEF